MSEAEKKKRQDYIRNRRTWIIIQIIVAVVLALDIILSLFTYYQLNKSHYVEYTEDGSAEYYVLLEDNEFYDKDVLDGGQAYVSELVKGISVFFDYELNMDADDVDYVYTYGVDAILEIKDQDKDLLYKETYNLIPEHKKNQNSNKRLEIDEKVAVDFNKFNEIASSFIDTYEIKNAKASLSVRMNIDVTGNSASFENNSENSYFISLDMPLVTQTTKINTVTSVDSGMEKVLSYNNNVNQNVFKASAIISSILEIVVIVVLVVFIFKSRNHDINYTIKVRKILSSYKSYIQKIVNEVDTTDYQLLYVETFREMLEIRDTIGAPILMNENEDKTRSRFFILTNTKILYIFEIKIENYDEIYGEKKENEEDQIKTKEIIDEESDEPLIPDIDVEPEIIAIAEMVIEESTNVEKEPALEIVEEYIPVQTQAEEPDAQIEEPAAILAYLDNDGNKLDIRYSRSFEANLIQSDETVKDYYNDLKNYIMSFKGVKSRFSWKFETFNKGRNPFFKIKLRGKTILLYCAIDPESIDKAKYRHDAINNKLFADVPTLLKIKAGLNVRRAKEIIDLVMSNFEMEKNPKAQEVDYKSLYPYEDNKSLIEKGLIKTLDNDK